MRRKVMNWLGPAVVACVTTCATTAGCTLILDFGADVGPTPDAGPDQPDADPTAPDSAPMVDAANNCAVMEPNDNFVQAVALAPGSYPNLAICPAGDHDFFTYTLDGAQDVVVEITFVNDGGNGDLEMRMFDSLGQVVGSSTGFDNDERIERSPTEGGRLAAGTYSIEVYGFNNTIENNYMLTLTVTGAPMP